MNPKRRLKYSIAFLLFAFSANAQSEYILLATGKQEITAADTAISNRSVTLKLNTTKPPVLKIPKRKNDSPFFCDELIKYKDGYIINSITTAPSGGGFVNIRYNYYYYNLTARKLYKLTVPGIDTIESIITYKNAAAVYVSGKANGQPQILRYDSSGTVLKISVGIVNNAGLLGGNSWIKLCNNGTALYALDKNGLYNFDAGNWATVAKFSIDSFYTQNLHYKRSVTVIPTENIQIHNNKLYFLQEVLQERDCYLVEYDLDKKNGLVSFWDKFGIRDRYKKEIDSYTVLNNGSVLIGALRLLGSNLLMRQDDDSLSVLVFKNMINNGTGFEGDIQARKAIQVDSQVYIAADNGIFKLAESAITPLAYFTNGSQDIKDHGEVYHFDFNPRCFEKIDHDIFVIGGLFGGLYQVDLKNNKIICLDDVDYDKITSLTLQDIQ